MKESCKQHILELLKDKPNGMPGGVIEDMIRETYGYKASNVSRRCRELYSEGKLSKREIRGFVEYKLNN